MTDNIIIQNICLIVNVKLENKQINTTRWKLNIGLSQARNDIGLTL